MGWNNPAVPFKDHAALLAGKPGFEAPVSRKRRLQRRAIDSPTGDVTPYAELHCHSNFSFLDGASSPEDLIHESIRLGLHGLAITDHDGFYGAPQFAEAAAVADHRVKTVYGAELSLGLLGPSNGVADPESQHLLVLARGVEGYHRLAGAITEAHLRGEEGDRASAAKGRPVYDLDELAERADGHWTVLTGCRKGFRSEAGVGQLIDMFGRDQVVAELIHRGVPTDMDENDRLMALAQGERLRVVATGNVHYARAEQHRLAQAMSAIRARRSLAEMAGWLPPPTAHLCTGVEMVERFARYPGVVARTVEIADECAFDLRLTKPDLPMATLLGGRDPMITLAELTKTGFEQQYAHRAWRADAWNRIEMELAEIEKRHFAGFFVIVYDLVREAKERGILCQGRGSAASSAVCYALGITVIDPVYYNLPFERFISENRAEEPDIDVDFDSDRREEIIQYVYEKYGRRHAAQVANVVSYRPRMALRDAAKALGYSVGQQDAWSKQVTSWSKVEGPEGVPAQVIGLASDLLGSPRHLGIHSGGMILTERPIGEVCPIERARMEKRTVLQWDKDACEYVGLVKFDLLGLGMLSALDHMFTMTADYLGEPWDMASIPREESAVYDMLCRADSIGVFQVESRAQIGTLPRLLPRKFYDLVIEIALIRPGPIQGGAVHPYIKRATGKEEPSFIHPSLEGYWVLGRTLGVPLFQEQLMQMAEVLGNCQKSDVDLLRRAMGSKRGEERIEKLRKKLFKNMKKKGLTKDQRATVYQQILAFAHFGFAESHALSFATLVYASSWLKLHYPGIFLAALLRAQPMGFYSAQSLVQDAKRHGVEVRRPSLVRSGATATMEPIDPDRAVIPTGPDTCLVERVLPWLKPGTNVPEESSVPWVPGTPDPTPEHRRDTRLAVRLGLDAVYGLDEALIERIMTARAERPFADVQDLSRRAGLETRHLEVLATAGALEDAFGLSRREGLWVSGWTESEDHLPGVMAVPPPPLLPEMDEVKTMLADLWATGVSPEGHPFGHLRERLRSYGIPALTDLVNYRAGSVVTVAGVVTHRQRPGMANGITFLNLEDETGMLNVVCGHDVWKEHRKIAVSSQAMVIKGRVERLDGVTNLVADRLGALAQLYPEAAEALAQRLRSRDFR